VENQMAKDRKMSDHLTNQSRKVLALAEEAARNLNHEYVGTEHVLLALVQEQSAGVSDVLATFAIDADKIRAEIAALVTRGATPTKLRSLPLTPRAQRAVAVARDEARFMGERCVGPEHLFLGLMNDPAGIACQVLLNLGIKPRELTKEVFKVRLAQMKIIERVVRPVRASTPAKRKMRE
jgi:ATP-dependent Clp protease ATP-binding subunit ClpC